MDAAGRPGGQRVRRLLSGEARCRTLTSGRPLYLSPTGRRSAVAACAADPSNAPEWYVNIDAVTWKTEPKVEIGGEVAFVARFLGRRLESR